jgi:hypothetical protein
MKSNREELRFVQISARGRTISLEAVVRRTQAFWLSKETKSRSESVKESRIVLRLTADGN